MTLLPPDRLAELAATFPKLTQERRDFLVDFVQGTDPADLERLMEEHEMPGDEFAFFRACFGITDDTRPLPKLLPSETSL